MDSYKLSSIKSILDYLRQHIEHHTPNILDAMKCLEREIDELNTKINDKIQKEKKLDVVACPLKKSQKHPGV